MTHTGNVATTRGAGRPAAAAAAVRRGTMWLSIVFGPTHASDRSFVRQTFSVPSSATDASNGFVAASAMCVTVPSWAKREWRIGLIFGSVLLIQFHARMR